MGGKGWEGRDGWDRIGLDGMGEGWVMWRIVWRVSSGGTFFFWLNLKSSRYFAYFCAFSLPPLLSFPARSPLSLFQTSTFHFHHGLTTSLPPASLRRICAWYHL